MKKMLLKDLRIHRKLIFIFLYLVFSGFIKAETSNFSYLVSGGEGEEPKSVDKFDSTFNSAWDIYLNTWETDVLNPYPYDFNSFKQPVDLCLTNDTLGFVMPVTNIITSTYGPRHGRTHQGVDIDLETGDTVVSAFDGIVRMSRYYYGYGNMVVVRHHNGLETLYGHLSKVLVSPGDVVKAGTSVGLGGNTGHSFGSHLHFEIRFMGQPIDPAKFIAYETFSLLNSEVQIDSSMFDNGKLVKKFRNSEDHSETHYASVKKKKKYHTVKSGDTLSAIARKYHTSVSKLCKLNKIKSTSILRLGKKLRIR
jgi:murein DD-endopeptidase MepM/ murein hydrolase activator NlpD